MSESPPVISAVIIAYNGMQFLPDCLSSLIQDLEFTSSEVIVVDNGSTDGTVSYIHEHCPQASVIENGTNLGYARAFNIGVRAASGEYVYVLNQDLRFKPGCTRALLERLRAEPELGLIGPRYNGFDGSLQLSARAFPSYRHVIYHALLLDRLFARHKEFGGWKMGWFDHLTERYVDQPMGAVLLFPRRLVDEIGLMDERFALFGNDVDYCRRLSEAGYRSLYYPEAVVEHFLGASTSQHPYRTVALSNYYLYLYLKKYARPSEYVLLWLCGLLLLLGIVPRAAGRFFGLLAKRNPA